MFYKCPNCGRVYGYGEDGWYKCSNCRYPLKKAEEITDIKHPELSEHKVIGTVTNNNIPVVECPYCHSTNTRKLSAFAKLGTLSWGASPKEWHCNRCNSDF
ncbi:MAG: hypothetical protein K2N01_06240 [Lachnospiraceae bacterium]|nr:hypothetical protein [Lachnospiraceae bacterium]